MQIYKYFLIKTNYPRYLYRNKAKTRLLIMKYLKEFATTAQYEAYTADTANFITPNVSTCNDNPTVVHYNPYDPYKYVDLGLSVKWAKWNVGATKEEEYGLYFQWGDTSGYTADEVGSGEGQKYFSWSDYKYWTADTGSGSSGMTKYNSTDAKTVLDASDDAATANMGSNWRMPTESEFNELINTANTTSAWTTVNGVYGAKFTSKKSGFTDKYVFFPAAGNCNSGTLSNAGSYGWVWSSSLSTSNVHYCRRLYFDSGGSYMDGSSRYYGFSVRGVCVG